MPVSAALNSYKDRSREFSRPVLGMDRNHTLGLSAFETIKRRKKKFVVPVLGAMNNYRNRSTDV